MLLPIFQLIMIGMILRKSSGKISEKLISQLLVIFIIIFAVAVSYFKSIFSELIFLDDDTLVLVKFINNGFLENI